MALKAKSMANNIVIQGLDNDNPGVDTKVQVISFLRDKLKMDVHNNNVIYAGRVG